MLFFAILVTGSITFILSMRQIIRTNKTGELSQMLELERIKLETSLNAEIAIVLKLADSPLVRRYFANPGDLELEKVAFEEIASYRRAFSGFSIFWINDIDRMFYSDDNESYWVDTESPENYWYPMTLQETEVYNFNINYNPDLKIIRLWINAPVFDSERKPVGMVGTGIELSTFIDRIYQTLSDRVELYFFNAHGEITGAKDIDLVIEKRQIDEELAGVGLDILKTAKSYNIDGIQALDYPSGKIAVGAIPTLQWHAVMLMPDSLSDYYTSMTALFLVVILIISLIFIIFNIFINKFLNSLNKTMESLEAASKVKSNFLANMSHEIRTPLNAILGVTEIHLRNDALEPETMDAFQRIYNSGNLLLNIINDILDLSKIEAGKLEISVSKYDIASLINDTVNLNMLRIGGNLVGFELSADENIPLNLFGDELRIKQVLNNLLSNAFKYTKEGLVRLSVSAESEGLKNGSEAMLVFEVSDTGQGMTEEQVSRLFDEYSRFNTEANRATEGTGLGMSITRNLLHMMNGEIFVRSEPQKGSTFTIRLPQKTAGPSILGRDLAESLRKFQASGARQLKRARMLIKPMPYGSVLVVDDVESNLFVAKGLLAPYKLSVDTVTSGFGALEKITGGSSYDVIFMDHMMPQMDGLETMRKMRAHGYTGAIVALTANALAGNDEMFRQKGFDGFIPKPIDVRQLNAVLNEFIRDRHPEEAKGYKPETTALAETSEITPELRRIFRRDAERAAAALRETLARGDLKLFTTTAHAMKAALANIGEIEASRSAFALESAGLEGDMDFIIANADRFIKRLEAMAASQPLAEAAGADGAEIREDAAFLAEQLQIIKSACEDYDEAAAYAALDRLKEKPWKPETIAALDEIHGALFLHSDFDRAAELAGAFREQVQTNAGEAALG
jgi:signal transduction histidine kinase/CheY-like chemotaxis protein